MRYSDSMMSLARPRSSQVPIVALPVAARKEPNPAPSPQSSSKNSLLPHKVPRGPLSDMLTGPLDCQTVDTLPCEPPQNNRHVVTAEPERTLEDISLIHISEPTRLGMISYAVFCLKK